MARTRVRCRRVVLSVLALAITAFVLGPVSHAFGAGAEVRRTPQHTYVVRAGDTLWSIADREVGAGVDPRPLIEAMQRANLGVGVGELVPGEALVIPASA